MSFNKLIFSIYYGHHHENNVMMSCKTKALFHLFLLSKSWMHHKDYPYMIVYEDRNGIFHVKHHFVIKSKHISHLSLEQVTETPSLLEKLFTI